MCCHKYFHAEKVYIHIGNYMTWHSPHKLSTAFHAWIAQQNEYSVAFADALALLGLYIKTIEKWFYLADIASNFGDFTETS